MIDLNDILAQQNKWLTMDLSDEAVVINTVNTTMKKCADAITSLCQNLQKIGYPWATIIKVSPEVQENAIQPCLIPDQYIALGAEALRELMCGGT